MGVGPIEPADVVTVGRAQALAPNNASDAPMSVVKRGV
jgi:hypothetical protein